VSVDVEQDVVDQLELGKQTVVFFLVEEAITNARKHAQAALIAVRLRRLPKEPNIALLEIADNGRGFNVQEVLGSYEKRSSLGMVNLRERADLVNGLLNLDSAPGKGTRVRIYIPLTEEAADRMQRGKVAK
jgi:signal transduction histidine kinase